MTELASYVDVWSQAIDDLAALLASLPEDAWSTPTDLAGWDVRAIASHVAHLEGVLATGVEEQADVGEAPHITSFMGTYTEIGVVSRRTSSPASILEEIRGAAATRRAQLAESPPTDPDAIPPRMFGGVQWTWRTLLRNRPLDIWMHEQDVRRAVGRPGGMDSAPAQHTADYLIEAFGFVLAKKAGAPAGTVAVLAVDGSSPFAALVGPDGRGAAVSVPPDPDVTVSMDRETFIVLAGGRRSVAHEAVTITGDHALGERLVASMGTTP